MKYLAVFLLVCLGLASAVPLYSDDFELDEIDEFILSSEGGGRIGERMKELFENMVERMRKAFEDGKGVREDLFKKAQDVYDKLKNLGVEISEKIKEVFENLRNKVGQNGPEFDDFEDLPFYEGGFGERLKELFEKMVERMRKAFEDGKGVREDLFKKAQDLYDKLKNMGVEISDKLKEMFEEMRNKVSKNGPAHSEFDFPLHEGGIGERLKNLFEQMVERMRKAFEDGKGVREDLFKKAQDLYDKLKNMGVELSDKIKEMFEEMRNKVSKNGPANSEFDDFHYEGDLGERLKALFQWLLEKFEKALDSGREVREEAFEKLKQLFQRLEYMGVEISAEIREKFEELINRFHENKLANSDFPLHEGGFGEKMRELFERLVERMKKAMDNGLVVKEDMFKRAQELYDKLKNLGVEISDKIKEMFEEMRNKMSKEGPTSSNADISNIFDMFKRLRELIKGKLDADELKAKVEKLFGKGSEMAEQIINMLKEKGEKGKNKILDWIDRVIPDKEERSISEVYEKIREYFRELNIDLKERFTKFGEWVKEQYEKGLEKGKTKVENIKRIAKEFLEDTKAIKKDMAQEALEFFREYKQDLGRLYDDIVDKVRDILKS